MLGLCYWFLILLLEWIEENPTIQVKTNDSDVKISNEPSVKKDEYEKVLAKTEPPITSLAEFISINKPNAAGGCDQQQDEGM